MHNLALKGEVTATPMGESWPSYVRRITEGLDRKAIADAAEMNVSGVSRWLTGVSRPSPEKAINFARSLNHSPVEALIAAGYLEETDTDGQITRSPLAELSDDALVDELRQRLRSRAPLSASDVLGPIPSFADDAKSRRATK
jgi:transcriptional regulator with XRE-family HTH domain